MVSHLSSVIPEKYLGDEVKKLAKKLDERLGNEPFLKNFVGNDRMTIGFSITTIGLEGTKRMVEKHGDLRDQEIMRDYLASTSRKDQIAMAERLNWSNE